MRSVVKQPIRGGERGFVLELPPDTEVIGIHLDGGIRPMLLLLVDGARGTEAKVPRRFVLAMTGDELPTRGALVRVGSWPVHTGTSELHCFEVDPPDGLAARLARAEAFIRRELERRAPGAPAPARPTATRRA